MSQSIIRLLGLLVLLILAVLGIAVFQYFYAGSNFWNSGSPASGSNKIIEAVRTGNFEDAVANNAAIQSDPTKSADEKALATYNTLGSQYRVSADVTDSLKDIQNMKKVILDPAVSLETRVNTLDVLGKQFYISGRNPVVFAEIYKDAPFNQYLVEGDPDLSARKLFEWSYELMPTSNSAISIARWYSEQYVLNKNQLQATTDMYAKVAEDYLKKAEAASFEEAQGEPSYVNSRRYLYFQYWRTIIIARLAIQIGEPYASQSRTAYENFIAFAQTQQNVIAKEFLMYARLFFAQRLVRDSEVAVAEMQLNALAIEMRMLEKPEVNAFVLYLKNEYKNAPEGANWIVVTNMMSVSPEFKAEVEKVLVSARN